MYEALTALIPVLKTDNFGEWIVDRAGMCVSLYCARPFRTWRGKRRSLCKYS